MSFTRMLALSGCSLLGLAACSGGLSSPFEEESNPLFSYSGTLNISNVWLQGFEVDADGWFANGSLGGITRVASGTNGIPSASGVGHGVVDGAETPNTSGAFSRFDGYRSEWPGDYVAEMQVYLDPAWTPGDGFDYSVASSKSDGNHLRDFIFHVGVHSDGRLLVNGSNNTDFKVNSYKLVNDGDGTPYQVTQAGWYTLQHIFYDDGGVLNVDLNLLDISGNLVFTTTRANPADVIGTGGVVGGNRYGWVIFESAGGLAIDNHRLGVIVTSPGNPDDCKNGGWQAFGFRNQGLCIASLKKP